MCTMTGLFPRPRVWALLATPLLLLPAGCESNGGNGLMNLGGLTGSDRASFRCDDDRSFRVNYNDGGDEAVVDTGDETYRLERADRDGGRRIYTGDDATLTVDGNEARLEISGSDDYDDCDET
jgi:hypothetical protein